MLQQISEHIRECLTRAEQARRRAAATSDPERKADYELAAQSWLRLADSYALSEQLERSLIEQDIKIACRGEWRPVCEAPFDREIEIAVIKSTTPHAVAFPCRRILGGWMNAKTRERLKVRPTHWREWQDSLADAKSADAVGSFGAGELLGASSAPRRRAAEKSTRPVTDMPCR